MVEDPDEMIIRQAVDTDATNPAVQVAESVADIEDEDPTNLPAMYECVDGVLDNIFSNPPDPEAQLQVVFSYDGYRITIHQDGVVEFVKIE